MRDFTAVVGGLVHRRRDGGSPVGTGENRQEFIALAKSSRAPSLCSSGPGSNKHLGGELFKLMTGTDILHVAYKGSTGRATTSSEGT